MWGRVQYNWIVKIHLKNEAKFNHKAHHPTPLVSAKASRTSPGLDHHPSDPTFSLAHQHHLLTAHNMHLTAVGSCSVACGIQPHALKSPHDVWVMQEQKLKAAPYEPVHLETWQLYTIPAALRGSHTVRQTQRSIKEGSRQAKALQPDPWEWRVARHTIRGYKSNSTKSFAWGRGRFPCAPHCRWDR